MVHAIQVSAGPVHAPDSAPLFTVAIPHYKYPKHLLVAVESIVRQSFTDVEILVSDDASPDDSASIVPAYLDGTGVRYVYYRQEKNLGYDGNVRFCLNRAAGTYALLLGNDDCLHDDDVLGDLADYVRSHAPDIAFANYVDSATAVENRRATRSAVLGSGPRVALENFRSFSFVSGILVRTDRAREHETDRWDHSIYYQIYLAARITAAGGTLGVIDRVVVTKDVEAGGRRALNYADRLSTRRPSVGLLGTGLRSVIEVTIDAIRPFYGGRPGALAERVVSDVLQTSYVHWLVEYRRLAGRSAAAGAARDLWPPKVTHRYDMSFLDRARVWWWYTATSAFGIAAPQWISRVAPSVAFARRRIMQRRSRPAA